MKLSGFSKKVVGLLALSIVLAAVFYADTARAGGGSNSNSDVQAQLLFFNLIKARSQGQQSSTGY